MMQQNNVAMGVTIMNVFIGAFFAHMLADFLLQSNSMVEQKSELKYKGFFRHFLGVLLPLFGVLLIPYRFLDAFLFALGVSLLHILLDLLKSLIMKRLGDPWPCRLFAADQFFHMVLLACAAMVFSGKMSYHPNFWETAFPVFQQLLPPGVQAGVPEIIHKVELTLALYIFFSVGAGIVIGYILRPFRDSVQEIGTLKAGKPIGIVERLLVLTLTVFGQYSAIAFIVAAKSLARHEDFNRRGFAEYYLLGTLLSIFTAITGGILIKYVLSLV
jgi:hypothetical protein